MNECRILDLANVNGSYGKPKKITTAKLIRLVFN